MMINSQKFYATVERQDGTQHEDTEGEMDSCEQVL